MADLIERLPVGCKMRAPSRYASDDDCKACGNGEGDACDAYIQASATGFSRQPRANILDNVTAGAFAIGDKNRMLKAEIKRLTADRDNLEQSFVDVCAELGCERDNEAALMAVHNLTAELASARALLAQYEQAPGVGGTATP